jgi:integrase/recombinase XerD
MAYSSLALETARCRLRRTSFAPEAEELARYYGQHGYAASTTIRYLNATALFGEWFDRRRLPVTAFGEARIGEFIRYCRRCNHRGPSASGARVDRDPKTIHAALGHLGEALRHSGRVAPRSRYDGLPPAIAAALRDLDSYLERVSGLALVTRHSHGRYIRDFLLWRFGDEPVTPAALVSDDFARYLVKRSETLSPASIGAIATALRCYLRFLTFRGQVAAALVHAVLPVAQWRHARLPQYLAADQLMRFLDAADQSLPSGRRDYAAFLLMCRLGLRASDVVSLTLDDIDWRGGTLSVRTAKTQRTNVLPLPDDVMGAIVAYVRNGRLDTDDRHLLVRHRAPMGRPINRALLCATVCRAYRRAGLPATWGGTHRLRHTAAANMLRGGASIKEIADVLAHRSIDTTAIYAKIDLEALREVALPWPGGVV